MEIRIETTDDTLSLHDGKIHALAGGIKYEFELSKIEQVLIITSDLGPFYDDMCLAIRIAEETAIFIMSGHYCYEDFLFKQLGRAIALDYEKIIQASMCIENNIFVIYKRT